VRTFKLGVGVRTVVLLWRSGFAWLEMKSLNPFFLLFLVLVPLSVLWSVDPSATLNRYVSLISIVTVCLAFTLLGWNRTRFQDVVRPVPDYPADRVDHFRNPVSAVRDRSRRGHAEEFVARLDGAEEPVRHAVEFRLGVLAACVVLRR